MQEKIRENLEFGQGSGQASKEAVGTKRNSKSVIKTTILVFATLVVLSLLFFYVGSNLSQIFWGKFFMYLYYPISGIIIVVYTIEMFGQFFEGDFVKAISNHIEVPVMVVTFTLTLFNPQIVFPDSYKTAGYLIIGTVLVWATHSIIKTYSKIASTFTFAALLTITGYMIKTIIESYMGLNLDLPFSPGNIVFYCFLATAALSLLSFFKYSSKDYLYYIGNKLSSYTVLFGIGVVAFFVQVYLLYIRPSFPASISPYLLVAEWTAVCCISFAVFKSVRDHLLSVSQTLKFGEWSVLTQKITNKKEELNIMSDFIDDGKKERLLMLISHILLSNDIPYKIGEEAIGELVQYRDPEPPKIVSKRMAGEMREENRRNRQRILEKTLKTVEDVINKNYLSNNDRQFIEPGELPDSSNVLKRCSQCGKEYPVRFGECPFCYVRKASPRVYLPEEYI
ncbi:MAG: hypothetical protein ABSB40_03975 [Nitrososphaeria archaeon]